MRQTQVKLLPLRRSLRDIRRRIRLEVDRPGPHLDRAEPARLAGARRPALGRRLHPAAAAQLDDDREPRQFHGPVDPRTVAPSGRAPSLPGDGLDNAADHTCGRDTPPGGPSPRILRHNAASCLPTERGSGLVSGVVQPEPLEKKDAMSRKRCMPNRFRRGDTLHTVSTGNWVKRTVFPANYSEDTNAKFRVQRRQTFRRCQWKDGNVRSGSNPVVRRVRYA